MATSWFYSDGSNEKGPVLAGELKQLAASGKLDRRDYVRKDGDANWYRAENVNGLFADIGTSKSRAGGAIPNSSRSGDKSRVQGHMPAVKHISKSRGRWVALGAAFVLLAGTAVWFFAVRDTWEADNAARIRGLAVEASTLTGGGDMIAAAETYKSLLAIVGDREVHDPVLREIVGLARTTVLQANALAAKQAEARSALKELAEIESQADALAAAGQFARAIADYQHALDHINTQIIGDKDASEIIARISKAKGDAAERLRLVEAEEARGELAKQEEASRAATQRMRAKVVGSMWLKRGAGDSFLLRGQKVYLIPRQVSTKEYREWVELLNGSAKDVAHDLNTNSNKTLEFAKSYRETAAGWKKNAERFGNGEEYRECLQKAKDSERQATDFEQESKACAVAAAGLEEAIKFIESHLLSEKPDVSFDIKRVLAIPALIDLARHSETLEMAEDKSAMNLFMRGFLSAHAVVTATTSVDGKYELGAVPLGEYYIYSQHLSRANDAVWLVPIDVKSEAPLKGDLFNDNALYVWAENGQAKSR